MIRLTLHRGALQHHAALLTSEGQWSTFGSSSVGVHVVEFEQRGSNVQLVTLFVSNGACNPDGTGFAGKCYFDRIALAAEPGLFVMHELKRPCIEATDLVKPLPSGQHVLDAGRGLVFRLALYRAGSEAAARSALDLGSLSIPRIVQDYGPQRMRLPQVNRKLQKQKWAAKLERQRKCLEGGYADSESYFWGPALGPYHLPEETLAGAYGGRRIQFVFGYGQVREEVLCERRLMDRFIERMVVHCFDRTTGARITSEDWAKAAGKSYQPFETSSVSGDEEARDPYAPNKAPLYPPALAPDRVFNQGSCSYEGKLREYDTIDEAHLCRAMGSAWAAWHHAGDKLARFYLANLAHHVRMSWCDIGPPPNQWSGTLRSDLEMAKRKPGQGRPGFGRGKGWALACLASGHEVARDDAERLQFDGALRMALDAHALAAMPSGLSQRASEGGIAEAWDIGALKPDEDGMQSFEFPIFAFGVLCALWQLGMVPTEKPPAPAFGSRPLVYQRNLAVLMRGARDLYAQGMAPTKYRVVGVKGGAPLMSSKPAGLKHDWAHVRELVADLWRASGHADFEQLTRAAAGPHWSTMLDVSGPYDYPEWYVSLVGMMQETN